MQFNYIFAISSLLIFSCCLTLGCSNDPAASGLARIKELNSTNVAKVRTCFIMYESRTKRWPKNQDELTRVLTSGQGRLDRALERIGVSSESFEEIFVSERDGKPLKIKWGIKMHPERIMPVAFEETGVDGVRLVAADVLLEVDNDEEYNKLWNGEYDAQNAELEEDQ